MTEYSQLSSQKSNSNENKPNTWEPVTSTDLGPMGFRTCRGGSHPGPSEGDQYCASVLRMPTSGQNNLLPVSGENQKWHFYVLIKVLWSPRKPSGAPCGPQELSRPEWIVHSALVRFGVQGWLKSVDLNTHEFLVSMRVPGMESPLITRAYWILDYVVVNVA